MYNFADSPLPVFFPVVESALLKTWFDSSLLDEGLQMIGDKRVTHFHSIRNTAGAVVENRSSVILQFEKSSKLLQGFMIRKNICHHCFPVGGDGKCAHMAALAILSLMSPEGEGRAKPFSLAYEESIWARLGGGIYDWLSRVPYTLLRINVRQSSKWIFTADEGRLEVLVPETWAQQGEWLFDSKGQQGGEEEEKEESWSRLIREMKSLSMTAGENQLLEVGSSSIGWKRAISPWTWLTRMLFLCHGNIPPTLDKEHGASGFVLRSGGEGSLGAFLLHLPRNKTWDFAHMLNNGCGQPIVLPRAKECYQVYFEKDNSLQVIPSLRLDDGRVLSRQELADNCFQNTFFLEDEGFLPVSRISGEATIKKPDSQRTGRASSLPLFGFIKEQESRDEPYSVALSDIPAFLEKNKGPLQHQDNRVDSDLKQLRLHELPDRLLIDSFAERDERCYLSCRFGLGDSIMPLRDVVEARKKNFSCVPGREWLKIKATPLTWFYELAEKGLADGGELDEIRLGYRELLALTAMIPDYDLLVKEDEERKRFSELLDVDNLAEIWLPSVVPAHLRAYQCNGLIWLNRMYKMGIGGLLADDMGLGKTHQGLALLQGVMAENRTAVQLVVCPASVLLNWREKVARFFPDIPCRLYYGAKRCLADLVGYGLVLTTYGVIRQDIDELMSHSFDIIMLDEIQHLKNNTTAVHQAVACLLAKVKIGLTGTPVENSLNDLHSLFDICLPGLLGNRRQFENRYLYPITDHKNSKVKEQLGRLVHPFILRRTRGQVLQELPDVIEDDQLCELSQDQLMLYEEVVSGDFMQDSAGEEGRPARSYVHILAMITKLKQICCHPCLAYGCTDPNLYQSGKWDLFVELASELLDGGMKFVVFSQYIGMLDLFGKHFQENGVNYCTLKGQMSVDKRQKMIDEFNNNPDCRVFCASLLAGGLGIDLTAANGVIHYDRWWNPAREEQATARVHRMGQKNVVQVFRLITKGTLEEKIHSLIQEKKELADSLIVEDDAGVLKLLDSSQLADLLRLG